jgi:deoxyribonuclease-1
MDISTILNNKKLKLTTLYLLAFIASLTFPKLCIANTNELSFNEAKKILTTIYRYNSEPTTFYCSCPIKYVSKKKMAPDLKACNYTPVKMAKRASRIEWEHIMPASWLGNQLQCWKNAGRKNCAKVSQDFIIREGDMHNLVPAIGEVNALRSNYRYSMLNQESSLNGCNFKISNSKPKAVEPDDSAKGFAARAMLYMASKYNIHLSKAQQKLMNNWNKSFPPTKWECTRNMMIKEYQGNDNPFITEKCSDK